MSVDWLFLVRVPPSVLAGDAYLDVDDAWRGEDYVIALGDRFSPTLERSAKRRRALSLDLTREHLAALRRSPRPREIVVTTDAAAPEGRGATYAAVREQWLAAGAFLLPDVVDEVAATEAELRAVPPLAPADVRVALPPGTRRARLRRLDPRYAYEQLLGRRSLSQEDVARSRAAVVSIDADGGADALEISSGTITRRSSRSACVLAWSARRDGPGTSASCRCADAPTTSTSR